MVSTGGTGAQTGNGLRVRSRAEPGSRARSASHRVAGGVSSPAESEPSSRPAAVPASAMREKILTEAATLFSTQGYAESGLREIAERVGIRSSTVYHHFESKERIYEEIIRLAMGVISNAVTDALHALPADATVRMRVEASISGHLLALHANRPFTTTNAQSRIKLPDKIERVIGAMREQYSHFWRLMLEQAKDSGALRAEMDPKLLRPLLLGSLNRTVGWFDPAQGSVDTLVATIVATFSGIWSDADGARAPPAATRSRRSQR